MDRGFDLAGLSTGYYGIPGRVGGQGHIVRRGTISRKGRPVCGTVIDARAEYQWCAHGIVENYVECERCKNWIECHRPQLWPQPQSSKGRKCGTSPCLTCPWRKSSKVGGGDIPGFNIQKMRRLRNTVGQGDAFRPVMACHYSKEDEETPCVGYVAVEGYSNISVRVLTARDVVDQSAIDKECAGIELWKSLEAMLVAYEATLAGEN